MKSLTRSTSTLLAYCCCCYIISQAQADNAAPKVKLGLYFESKCPDSRRFFLSQLLPNYDSLSPIMELNLVPFGKARVLGNNKMICQHGPLECEGNRLMACVQLKAPKDNGTEGNVTKAIGCLFTDEDERNCISTHLPNVCYDEIENCKNSDESYQVMINYERETGRVSYIPSIRINGQYSADIQEQCEFNLLDCICKRYTGGQLPQACKDQ